LLLIIKKLCCRILKEWRMTARTSPQMILARKLLKKGYSAYRAALLSGLHNSSIYRCKICRELIKKNKGIS